MFQQEYVHKPMARARRAAALAPKRLKLRNHRHTFTSKLPIITWKFIDYVPITDYLDLANMNPWCGFPK
jgi:hypothetical protein